MRPNLSLLSPGMRRRGSHTSFSLKRNGFFPAVIEEKEKTPESQRNISESQRNISVDL